VSPYFLLIREMRRHFVSTTHSRRHTLRLPVINCLEPLRFLEWPPSMTCHSIIAKQSSDLIFLRNSLVLFVDDCCMICCLPLHVFWGWRCIQRAVVFDDVVPNNVCRGPVRWLQGWDSWIRKKLSLCFVANNRATSRITYRSPTSYRISATVSIILQTHITHTS